MLIMPTYMIRMLMCTHCGCTGHLAKFCYDRINNLNFANKFVWARKGANPLGPKKIWYQNPPPTLFDVSVGSHLT